MQLLFDIFKYTFLGFFGFIFFIFLAAIIFGKRVTKKWEYEAKFRGANGKELGEFDIELSKVEKSGEDFSLKAKFELKHPELKLNRAVNISLDGQLVMSGMVETDGRIYLGNKHLVKNIENPQAGQICSVVCSDVELFSEAIYND